MTKRWSHLRGTPLADNFSVRVQPRASSNRVVVTDETVKVYTTAPPVDGEANDAVISQLAKLLKVSQSSIHIVSGHTSRTKSVRVEGFTASEAIEKLRDQQK